jgi:hypothetical protein
MEAAGNRRADTSTRRHGSKQYPGYSHADELVRIFGGVSQAQSPSVEESADEAFNIGPSQVGAAFGRP